MSQGVRRPWQAVDYDEIVRAYPPAPEYYETTFFDDPETIARLQLQRLKDRATSAYRVPFFRRRWDAAGFHPSALQSLEDLHKAPTYTVDDIRRSIEDHPPWGDYQGVTLDEARREPVRVFMSGGTTGASRPTLYTQWDREVGALLMARQLYRQGIRFGDVVLNSWAYGTHNGAFIYDEALHRWLNCVVLTTSTGNVTSSERQVELAMAYGAAAIVTTGDYLLRLADVARQLGYDPRTDLALRAIPNIGDRALLEETFGPEYFDTYGFHEVQTVAVECEAHDGLHIFEDAYVVQVLDTETGEPAPDGQLGSLCVTELYKTGSPQFRYNIMDLATLYPPGRCACGSWLRRMSSFAGRGDNMVKLRGINVWPEAVGDMAAEIPGASTDYFVRAVRRHNRDELLLSVVSEAALSDHQAIGQAVAQRLRDRLGVRIEVEVVVPGALDAWTGVGTAAKLKRFADERGREPDMTVLVTGTVDYLCNAFGPERASAWDAAIAAQGLALKIQRAPDDSFTAPDDMVARMDDLEIATVIMAACDPESHPAPFAFSNVAARFEEVDALVRHHPGRFAALWTVDPDGAMDGVRRAEEALAHRWVVGLYVHTHSHDRRFDHADYYPYYALADGAGVPVVMQAGISGGRMPSECGRPIGIDRPALYFPDTDFVLSHTGWPWVDEAVAMALKFSNVYLGTASYPPRRWPAAVVDFLGHGGRTKVLFGTNFPTVGHRHALAQLDELHLDDAVRHRLLEANARSIFGRL